MMPQMAQEEEKRIHASRADPSLTKTAEKALLDAVLAGSDATDDGLRTSPYNFSMHVFTIMAAL